MIPAWIDEFSSKLKEIVFFREEDRVLIIPPNQVYSLNETAVKLLKFLFEGGSLSRIIETGGKQVSEDIISFLKDLKEIVEGQFREDNVHATEFEAYKKNFYSYPVLSETNFCNIEKQY